MQDEVKTKEELLAELRELRDRVAELETSQREHNRAKNKQQQQFGDVDQPSHFNGLVSDAVESRKLLDALHQVMLEQRTILDTANVGISLVRDRKQVWINRKTEEMFQYPKEELVGQTTRKLYPSQEAYEELGRKAYPLLSRGMVYETEQELIRRDGSHIWVKYNGRAVDPPDLSVGTIWILEDITERKFMEGALRQAHEELEQRVADRAEALMRVNDQLHSEIGERKRAQAILDENRQRFQSIFESMGEIVVLHELICDAENHPVDYRILECNPAFTRATGIPNDQAAGALASQIYGTGEAPYLERYAHVAVSGEREQFEVYFAPMQRHFQISVASPKPGYFVTVSMDITERVHRKREIEILNRLYRVLSQVSQAVVRATSPEAFLEESCRVVAEEGGLLLSWIGSVERETDRVLPAAISGRGDDYARGITVYADDRPEGRGPTGRCIRQRCPIVYNDFLHDELAQPWRERAAEFGINSAAAFPILSDGSVWGALTVYSDKVDFFSEPEAKLLEKVAEEIGFALENMERRRERERAVEALRESEEQYRAVYENMVQGGFYQLADGSLLDPNAAALRIFGLTRQEFLRRSSFDPAWDVVHEDGSPFPGEEHPSIVALRTGRPIKNVVAGIYNRVIQDRLWVVINAIPQFQQGEERPYRVFVTLHDMTSLKNAEREQEATVDFLRLLNTCKTKEEMVSGAAEFFQRESGCEAVGIRLKEGDDYPYFETIGFPMAFVRSENHICARDQQGEALRDGVGNPVLECMCGNVIFGRFDPFKPFFTSSGSFWTNSTSELLASTTDEDRQTRTRNRCNGEGYESVALVALRSGNEPFGLLQLNDLRKGRFTVEGIARWERLAGYLAVALSKFKAEETLLEREKKYRSLFESMTQGVVYENPEGIFIDVNQAALDILGLTPDQFLGRTVSSLSWEMIREDGSRFPIEEYPAKVALRTGKPVKDVTIGLYNPRKKGYVWLNINAIPEFSRGGAVPYRVFMTLHDFTERKQTEERLQSSELFLKETQRIGRIGGWKVNPFTDYLEWTSGVYQIIEAPFDYTPGLTEGLKFFLPEYIPLLREKIGNCLTTGDPFTLECRARTATGKVIWTEVRGIVTVPGSERSYVVGTFQDITERKEANEAMRESERRYRMVANYTYDWEYWITPDGSFIYVSPSCERITGYCAEEFMGNPSLVESIAHPEDREWLSSHMRESSRPGEEACQKDYRIITREGDTRWISHYCRSIRTEDGTYLGRRASNRDISDRVRAKEDKEKAEAQLMHAQKLEAIGTLAGGIAHDFNNILAPIIGYTEMALEDIPESSPLRFDLDQVLAAAYRAKDLVKQILSFSRLGEDQLMRPVDASLILKEALKLLRASLPSSIDIRQDIRKVTILADATQIHQVVVNLCTNAAHAMEDAGILHVALLEADLSAQDLVELSTADLRPGKYLKLSVKDTGAGMSTETMQRIFDPYFTTKEVGKGTGLGLAVVHGIVKRHGGEILVRSEVGKGSVFDVFIPAAESELRREGAASPTLPRGSEQILLVDDEPAIAKMAARMLEQLGYAVTMTTSPKEALQLFRSQPDQFDLVITDYTMPQMVGTKLAEECTRIRPELPVIICTGHSDRLGQEESDRIGAKAVAMKPLDRKQLAMLVRDVLDGARD